VNPPRGTAFDVEFGQTTKWDGDRLSSFRFYDAPLQRCRSASPDCGEGRLCPWLCRIAAKRDKNAGACKRSARRSSVGGEASGETGPLVSSTEAGVAAETRDGPARQVATQRTRRSGVWRDMRPGRPRPRPPCRIAGEAGPGHAVEATTPPSATGKPGLGPSPSAAGHKEDAKASRSAAASSVRGPIGSTVRSRHSLARHPRPRTDARREEAEGGPSRPRQRHPAPSRPGAARGGAPDRGHGDRSLGSPAPPQAEFLAL